MKAESGLASCCRRLCEASLLRWPACRATKSTTASYHELIQTTNPRRCERASATTSGVRKLQQGGAVFVEDAVKLEPVWNQLTQGSQTTCGDTVSVPRSATLPVTALAVAPPDELTAVAVEKAAREVRIARQGVQT